MIINSLRSKRDSSSNLKAAPKYNVSMPAVNWGLSFGDDNISVDISRNVMNNFDIINGNTIILHPVCTNFPLF